MNPSKKKKQVRHTEQLALETRVHLHRVMVPGLNPSFILHFNEASGWERKSLGDVFSSKIHGK